MSLWRTFTVSRTVTLPKSSFTVLNFEAKRRISKILHKQNPSRNIQGHARQPCSRIIALYSLGLAVHERTGTRESNFVVGLETGSSLGAQADFKNLSIFCLSSQVLNYICVLCQLDTATVIWEEGTSTKTASPPACPLGLVCGSFS